MKIDEILNDKVLCAFSLLLILLWAGVKYRFYSLPRMNGETAAATLLRIACGLLLFSASLDKIGDPVSFSDLIKECYKFLPALLVPLAAVVIPWLEFFAGLCLISGFRWRGAAFIFCGLMAVYSIAISWDVLHGIDCSCGCFDKNSTEKMTWWTVLRDVEFLGMGLIVLGSSRTYAALDNFFERRN
jgi:uncharacterized membrane protein YphA (DoxX/SURF4 family)